MHGQNHFKYLKWWCMQFRCWSDTSLKTFFKENKTKNNSTAIAMKNFCYFSTLKLVFFDERVCSSPKWKCPSVNIFSKKIKSKKGRGGGKLSLWMPWRHTREFSVFSTLPLDGDRKSASCCGRFTSADGGPSTFWLDDWMDSVLKMRKISCPY